MKHAIKMKYYAMMLRLYGKRYGFNSKESRYYYSKMLCTQFVHNRSRAHK